MGARADVRRWGLEQGLSFGGGEVLAWLICVWKHRRVLRYDIIAQVV